MKVLPLFQSKVTALVAWIVFSASGLCAQENAQESAEGPPPGAESQAADRESIGNVIAQFVDAFESRKASTVADLFTGQAEFENVDGVKIRGRDALEQAFSTFFFPDAGTERSY